MIYIFIGNDSASKEAQLKKIKQAFLNKDTEQFNLDILYAREITLKGIQERLLWLPSGTIKNDKAPDSVKRDNLNKRVVIIKEGQDLKEEIKEFILKYASSPYKHIELVLDINPPVSGKAGLNRQEKNSAFINNLSKFAKIFRFQEAKVINSFSLSRAITLNRPGDALRLLNQLLAEGERPERILGGLRYVWEKDNNSSPQMKKKLALLLACDREIKTGRLKPACALEKLVICLCGFGEPLH